MLAMEPNDVATNRITIPLLFSIIFAPDMVIITENYYNKNFQKQKLWAIISISSLTQEDDFFQRQILISCFIWLGCYSK